MRKTIVLEFGGQENVIKLVRDNESGYRCISIGDNIVEIKSDEEIRDLEIELEFLK